MEYVGLEEYAPHMDINSGDIVFISSDSKKMMWDAVSRKQPADLNLFIDGIIHAVGIEGTVIFPTYNWDFCNGIAFDYYNTPSKTGSLGAVALKRKDFRRTKHPLYSFAVCGKYQTELCEMNNVDSFGLNSPFAFFRDHNVKNYIMDVTLQHCFTFAHFVEEHSGIVKYRYIKEFTADYIDSSFEKKRKTYSMYVRDLALDVQTRIDPIEDDFRRSGVEREFKVNNSEIKLIRLGDAYDIIMKDIQDNKSRKLCSYIGQEN